MIECGKVTKSVKMDTIKGLKESLPQIFEDGKVNFEKLEALLTDEIIEKEDDRFYLNWAGKSDLFRLVQAPAYGTLKPDKERSIDFEITKNIIIVGENLETLKLLLKPYFERIKMIYIDPPYNTGNDKIYRDNFKEPLRDYLEKTGQIDAEGSKLTTNMEASGRYHSDWLNFMYPRLFLARSLLREDGIIFVSIDDHEFHHLRIIMNDIFGEENFVGIIVWKTTTDNNPSQIAIEHEYIVCYAKKLNMQPKWKALSDKAAKLNAKFKELKKFYKNDLKKVQEKLREWIQKNTHELKGVEHYNRVDEKGVYSAQNPANPHPGGYIYDVIHPKTGKVCKIPTYGFRWPHETFKRLLASGNIEFGPDEETIPKPKKRLEDAKDLLRSVYYEDNRASTRKLRELFDGKRVFDNPKSVNLLSRLMKFTTKESSIILDFFAGAGSTGEAVWELNSKDGDNRKFILVNLDEPVQDEDIKKDFSTVADICIERLTRLSKKWKENKDVSSDLDFRFKVFKLDKSNFNLKNEFELEEDKSSEDLRKKYLEWLGMWIDEPLVKGCRTIDVVYELILKEGLELNSKIEEMKIKDNDFFHVFNEEQQLEFYTSLDEEITKETVENIRTQKYKDKLFIFLDKALTDNDKINLSAFVNLKVI